MLIDSIRDTVGNRGWQSWSIEKPNREDGSARVLIVFTRLTRRVLIGPLSAYVSRADGGPFFSHLKTDFGT